MSNWTEFRVEYLKKCHDEGLSASQIASRIGGVTRNAVIGKIHRLRLPTRTVVVRKPRAGRPRTGGWKPIRYGKPRPEVGNPALRALFNGVAPDPMPPKESDVPRKSLEDLEERDCRFPITIRDSVHHFCAAPKVPGLSYCEAHARRCYEPPRPRFRQPPPQPVPAFADLEKEDA